MPYALVTIGLLMIITGINNTYSQFGAQLQSDFTGSKSFFVWIIAIGSVGALGYIKDLRTFSHYFMALIIISLVLANKGLFSNLQAAINAGPKAPQANTSTTTAASSTNVPSLGTAGSGSTDRLYVSPSASSTNQDSGSTLPGLSSLTSFLLNPTGQTQ